MGEIFINAVEREENVCTCNEIKKLKVKNSSGKYPVRREALKILKNTLALLSWTYLTLNPCFLAHQNEQVVMRTSKGEKKHKKELSHIPEKGFFSFVCDFSQICNREEEY